MQRLAAAIRIALLLVLVGVAHADHHGMAMEQRDTSSPSYTASVSLLGATFSPSQSDNMYYGGDYEAVVGGFAWSYDRVSAGASWAYYRMQRNGERQYGVGDLVASGQVALVQRHDLQTGVLAAISLPAGNEDIGLGMGHVMLMPAAYAASRLGAVAVTASLGYSRALASGGHVHGMAPLVEPMNMSELTWSLGADVPFAAGVHGGARIGGGLPIAAAMGTDRVVGALRIAWGSRNLDTGAELQAGLDGDPFTIRGVVSTALRF